MSVTVKDVLSLDLFNNAIVVAGKNGLNNEVKRINFTDCPFPDDILDCGLVEKGDLFINSLYIAKEDDEKLLEFFKYFVICESAGTFIITEFLSSLPQNIIDFCNKYNLPAVFVDPKVPYATIIKDTMEMVLVDQWNTINEMKVDKLLDKNITKDEIIKLARFLNKNFKKYYACAFINLSSLSADKIKLINSILKNNQDFNIITYNSGIFIIINFDKIRTFDTVIPYIESIVNNYISKYKIGVSNIFSDIEKFDECIHQSLSAYDISHIINNTTVYYKNLNIYKLLYPIKDNDYLKDFYNDIIVPLINYDNDYKSDLINTIERYLENDGDYKKTAADLNQHENTVRYRILKAKKILDMENNNFKFIEQISVGLKIKHLLDM